MSAGILISLILLVSVFCQYVAWRTKFPAILFLILAGLILGPIANVINVGQEFDQFLEVFLPVSAALILFEGGLSLNFHETKSIKKCILSLIFVAAPISYILTYFIFHKIGGLSFELSLIISAIFIISGPTVILPIIKNSKLNKKTSSLLKWEGIILDPVGALVAIFCYEYIVKYRQSENLLLGLLGFATILVTIIILSFLAARLVKILFERGIIPEFLKIPFMISFAFSLYFFAGEIMHEGGLISITIFAIALANLNIPKIKELILFKENIIIMVLSMVFIFIVANLDYNKILSVSIFDILLIILFLFLVRPISIFAALLFTKDYKFKEKIFLGLIAPKGVICVVLVTFLSGMLTKYNIDGVDRMLTITMWTVFLSIVSSSFIAAFASRYFNVRSENEAGVILVGGSGFVLELGKKLQDIGFKVMIVSQSFDAVTKARMSGLTAYHGEILSEQAHFSMHHSDYQYLIIASENPAYNSLVYTNLLYEFGRSNIFQVKTEETQKKSNAYNENLKAKLLTDEASIADLNSKLTEGWLFKRINISEDFTVDDVDKAYGKEHIKLFKFRRNRMSLSKIDNSFERESSIILFSKEDK